MSVKGFGRTTPLQGNMLAMAGIVTWSPNPPTKELRIAEMRVARKQLIAFTKENFEFDLAAWHEYLQKDPVFSKEYKFSYAWKGVKRAIEDQINNPERVALAVEASRGFVV